MPPFPYKKVLITGATSGIGRALAVKFLANGTSVIAVGRREDNLRDLAAEHSDLQGVTLDTAAFDVANLSAIPNFVADMFSKHPDLDCIFLNAGLQRELDWEKHTEVDLGLVEYELTVNYLSPLHFTKAVLPDLEKQSPKPTSIIYTTSGLAMVPMHRCANYCASKAALHHMCLSTRAQLKKAGSTVKIVELFPPAVQTELHDEKHQPGFKNGGSFGMPLDEFTEEAYEGLCREGEAGEQVAVQVARTFLGFETWERERQGIMQKLNKSSGYD